jgi:protein-disulfide isomerase
MTTSSLRNVLVGAALLGVACSTSAQQPRQMAPNEVVVRIGSVAITLGEVDERALQETVDNFGRARLVQALYMARRAAAEELVADRLLDIEAKSRGIDRATLEAKEIGDKATAPTDADVEFWYQTNPDQVQGRPFEQLKAPIRSLLANQRTREAREAFLTALRVKTPVSIMLEPPRQTVAASGHPGKGPEKAPVEIVEFSDFQCPFCQRANPTVDQVLKTYGDKIHFVYRHYPLPTHANARPAAEAAACANSQGKFWPYHDRLFANAAALGDADLKGHAAAIGLDAAAFNACFDGHQKKSEVDRDIREAEEVGVTGTPAFFINGRSLEGAQPFEAFKQLIDEELATTKR